MILSGSPPNGGVDGGRPLILRQDRAARRLAVRAGIVLAVATLVAGCFQPLYRNRSGDGAPGLRQLLSGVEIARINAAANSPESRLAVLIQNQLRFRMTGGGEEGRPTHRLVVEIAGSRQVVSTTNVTGLPNIENFVLNASYSLVEKTSGRSVLTGRATTTVSYDPAGTQRFARISGMQDAERRAADVIAETVSTRLAAYFVSGS